MFTGYNSEVELDGKAFHVQTEDKGLDNPVVESRVYRGGEVVASVLTSYADLADSPDYARERIQQRMQEQHQSLIEDLRQGRLEAEPTIRRKAMSRVLDPDNLIEEYVEDWIEASNLIAPVHQALEQRVDAIQNEEADRLSKKKEARAKRTRASLALLVFLISVVAAFELGRVSQRSAESASVPTVPHNASVSVGAPLFAERVPLAEPAETSFEAAETPAVPEVEVAKEPDLQAVEPQAVRSPVVKAPQPAPAATPEPVPPVTDVAEKSPVEPLPDVEPPRQLEPVPETAPTEPPGGGPFEIDEVDRPPVSLPHQAPLDTPASGLSTRKGSVRMKVLVGPDGGIDAVRMTDEITDSAVNKAAIGAILHWRFAAGSHRETPVSVWVPVRLDFSLANNRMKSAVTVTR